MCNMEFKNTGYRIPKVNSTSRNIQKIIYYTFPTLIWLIFLLFHAWCCVLHCALTNYPLIQLTRFKKIIVRNHSYNFCHAIAIELAGKTMPTSLIDLILTIHSNKSVKQETPFLLIRNTTDTVDRVNTYFRSYLHFNINIHDPLCFPIIFSKPGMPATRWIFKRKFRSLPSHRFSQFFRNLLRSRNYTTMFLKAYTRLKRNSFATYLLVRTFCETIDVNWMENCRFPFSYLDEQQIQQISADLV